MNRFLRLLAPVAALGLIVGCAGEDGAGVTPPPEPTNAPLPAPESPTPPPAVDAEAPDLTPPAEPKTDGGMTSDLTPAEAHKAEEANHPEGAEAKPADEAKKEDAPLTPPQAEEPKDEAKKDEAKAEAAAPSLEGPGAATAALSDEEIAEIKKLPAEDHDLALAQAVCPVSDENLGSMDVPLKVSAEGRDFFICCKGCEKKVKSDPKGVIAKLDGAKK